MNKGYLSDYFAGVGSKILTRVDATQRSNQHEIGDGRHGVALRRILGDRPRKKPDRFHARYVWLCEEQEAITGDGYLSWYDTREKDDSRSPEWRLCYQSNKVTELMDEGDSLFVARRNNDTVFFIVIPKDSPLQSQVSWLFAIYDQPSFEFGAQEITVQEDSKLDFISRFILDELGIEFEDPDANSLDTIIERYGMAFPTTSEFSDLARLTLPKIDARDDPDAALLAWLNHEEGMFRRLEKKIVAERVSQGFDDDKGVDVDAFIRYSLRVQNRRKSRMGHSFENHLKALFDACEVRYDAQVKTEKGKKPDFIFPGKKEYFDTDFDIDLLTTLAAKSSCKDRWSQILPEAERILVKHLITLEPGISEAQTEMMRQSNVQLIVPSDIRISYTGTQQDWILSISDFVNLVRDRQAN